MLSIGKIALGQHRYYEQQVAQGADDYYSGRGEAPGEWVGGGSDALGLSGRASSHQFSALIAGLDPRAPDRRLRSSDRDPKVAALDLTFSAPKSISVLAEFSKRRREMLREAESGGIPLTSKAAAESAAIATRDRKRYGIQTHTWREEVRARAGELGLTRAAIAALIERGRRRTRAGLAMRDRINQRSLGDRLTGPQGLTERANTFDERVVLQQFAAHARSGLSVDEVRAHSHRFIGRCDVIRTDRGEMTTTELVACERRLIAAALGRASEGAGIVAPDLIRREISRAPFPLTTEQATAVNAAINSCDGVSVIEALAGTGKTFTAGVLGAVYGRAGYEVLGVAPTARAARELSEQASIPSRTLDRLLLDIEQLGDELPRRCVVILDEAGMAPTRSSAALLALAARAEAKVIAIGDPGQLASVQAGGWLRAVGPGLGAHRLTEVMRQRDPDERRALEALHEREPHRYLEWAQTAAT
ncbi:MAG: hypothetical protein E6G34_10340 [Actinobacteria bacterium]|nr:MAG: hypothetical protein E6G34_10340 [Actinomycetota bacterium]